MANSAPKYIDGYIEANRASALARFHRAMNELQAAWLECQSWGADCQVRQPSLFDGDGVALMQSSDGPSEE